MRECTLKGFVLGGIFAVLFTVANTYLGLKVGMTIASSIPAAVVSMSVLRMFKSTSILENNIVQTIASVGGTIATIIFVLPALVILGYWQNFPFWQTFLLATIGGILGVLFTVPLRRALVIDSDLPYPEGTVAAETLKAGCNLSQDEEEVVGHPLRDLTVGGLSSFLFTLCTTGLKVFAGGASYYGKIGGLISGIGFQYSFALLGTGYLVGLRIGIAILIGVIISWGIAVPVLSWHHPVTAATAGHFAIKIWVHQVRFIGAGTLAIGAILANLKLAKPIYRAVITSVETAKKRRHNQIDAIATHERDLPINWVLSGTVLLALPLMSVFAYFVHDVHFVSSTGFIMALVAISVFLVILVGFLSAGTSGYMTGLVGSSISPLSGIAILATTIVALFLSYFFSQSLGQDLPIKTLHFITALTIVVVAVVVCSGAISNDNLQDLKTGYLIGSTPWKQQVSLIFGVILGALVLSPVLNQLYHAYGFVGALPSPGMDPKQAMSAPQATLMAAIAQGIITHHMHWKMLLIGAAIGTFFLMINKLLTYTGIGAISIMSIGFGLYLPPEVSCALPAGGILAWLVDHKIISRAAGRHTKVLQHCGILLASGWIVGESLFGVLNALLVGVSDNTSPMAIVGSSFAHVALVLGTIVFVFLLADFYYYIRASKNSLVDKHG